MAPRHEPQDGLSRSPAAPPSSTRWWPTGSRDVFGIPGTHNLELYRYLPTSGIRHVVTRHEQGAGLRRRRLRPGQRQARGAHHHLGPGDHQRRSPRWPPRTPTPCPRWRSPRAPRGAGWAPTSAGCTRSRTSRRRSPRSAAAASGSRARTTSRTRWRTSSRGSPAVARGRCTSRCRWTSSRGSGCAVRCVPAPRPARFAAGRAAVDAVAAALVGAARPLVIAGGGARAAAAEVRALADLGIPVLTTVNGKGVLDEQHPVRAGSLRAPCRRTRRGQRCRRAAAGRDRGR